MEWITSWTALPNLHPALVHFPIALLPTAALFDLAAGLFSRHRDWLARAATALWGLAGAGTGAAYWAGRQAADSLVDVPPQLQAHIGHHSDWGLYTVWAVGVVAATRLVFGLLRARASGSRWWALVGLGLVGLVAYTADLGGGLVYEHGVAVAGRSAPPASGDGAPGARVPVDSALAGLPTDRLVRAADGTLTWRPLPGDKTALGEILQAAPGSTLEGVSAVAAEPQGAPGLGLLVRGRTLLLLPGSFGDVQVQATLEPESFRGTLGLAHHVRTAEAAELFTVTVPAGRFALEAVSDSTETLDAESHPLPAGTLALAVGAAGRHLRGTLGGELVVHGHRSAPPAGSVGLLLDGEGLVRIVSLEVIPIHP